jgi:hypothetical protein
MNSHSEDQQANFAQACGDLPMATPGVHKPAQCGGQLQPSSLGRPGDCVACPFCGKAVKLRRPFNGNNTGWVQVPRHASSVRLTSAQRFLLREMTNKASIIHLQRHYDRTRRALQDKGLISFNTERGMYEVTPAGKQALEAAC